MIAVLTSHWAIEEKFQDARILLDGNGIAQSKAPGFYRRTTLVSLGEPTKITTLVIWENEEVYEGWRNSPERANAMMGAENLWSKGPESERFEFIGSM